MNIKKVLSLIFATVFVIACLCNCSGKTDYSKYNHGNQKPSENLDILTSCQWEYDFDGCAYELFLEKDGTFINYCSCGSPAGYSDLVEYYIYDDETKTLYLYDMEKEYIGEGKVLEISKDKVIIEKYDEICTYVPVDY